MKKNKDTVVQIPLDRLVPFPDHPFRVSDDDWMRELAESIRSIGVLTPITVCPVVENKMWQIVSGHRRVHACALLEMESIPAIEKEMDVDEAIVHMVDSNLQREILLPSEKARAYKMKLDAVKRQGARNDLTSAHAGQKLRKSSRDMMAENSPDSSTQIQRFIRLNKLIPELMELVDSRCIALTPAVELSYLKNEEQEIVAQAVESEQASPSHSQAQRIRKLSANGKLTDDKVLQILSEKKKAECWNLVLPMNKVSKYFPSTYTPQQMQNTIIHLLEGWLRMKKREEENTEVKSNEQSNCYR